MERCHRCRERLSCRSSKGQAWNETNALLLEKFQSLTPEQWLERHTAMTDEDHAKDPTRNRFSVLLNRTNHTAFHLGQLVLVREKKS